MNKSAENRQIPEIAIGAKDPPRSVRCRSATPMPLFGIVALLCLVLAVPLRAEDSLGTLIAVGDIAKCKRNGWFDEILELLYLKDEVDPPPEAKAIADQVERLPGTILALGDLAYPKGSQANIRDCFDRVWGGLKDRTRPAPGNHDFKSDEGRPYFEYWGASVGEPGRGYYSFDLASWHIIALNSNIDSEPESEQNLWLDRDLAATNAPCVLAYWHHPVFSSGKHGDDSKMKPILKSLFDQGVTIVLSGHDHTYERFAPQDPEGRLDDARGFIQFIVGTGGSGLRKAPKRISDNSRSFTADNLGVLKLELFESRFEWVFMPATESGFQDSGTAQCVTRPRPESTAAPGTRSHLTH
jgi:hypothetical protein